MCKADNKSSKQLRSVAPQIQQHLKEPQKATLIPTIVNGVIIKPGESRRNPYWCSNKPIHEVILNGDSHIKGLATELQSVLPSDYKVLSVLKPGSGSEVLSESFKETVKHLSMKDIFVISSGTNDYNLDNFKTTFKNIKEYITSIIHTNILVLGLPNRYDRQNNLDVNSKIHIINKKLSKLVSILPNAHFLDSNDDRNLYTKAWITQKQTRQTTDSSPNIFSYFHYSSEITIQEFH